MCAAWTRISAHKLFSFTDYKRTSLAKYVRYFDQFLDGLAHSWKGELLKKSGKFLVQHVRQRNNDKAPFEYFRFYSECIVSFPLSFRPSERILMRINESDISEKAMFLELHNLM